MTSKQHKTEQHTRTKEASRSPTAICIIKTTEILGGQKHERKRPIESEKNAEEKLEIERRKEIQYNLNAIKLRKK